eukprot:350499-Pyramimonas_sp.AAC.2
MDVIGIGVDVIGNLVDVIDSGVDVIGDVVDVIGIMQVASVVRKGVEGAFASHLRSGRGHAEVVRDDEVLRCWVVHVRDGGVAVAVATRGTHARAHYRRHPAMYVQLDHD